MTRNGELGGAFTIIAMVPDSETICRRSPRIPLIARTQAALPTYSFCLTSKTQLANFRNIYSKKARPA